MITAAVKVRLILVCAVALTLVGDLRAQTQYEVVHTFSSSSGPEGGLFPSSGPMAQADDESFYGITDFGGEFGFGTVFHLTPDGAVTPVASFDADMGLPSVGSGLLRASDGDFYGTTEAGGADGVGAVFRVTPDGSLSTWASFDFFEIGATPSGRLIEGSDGYLYGTAIFGPEGAPGVVFRVNQAWGSTGEAGIIERFAVFPVDMSAGDSPSAGVTEAPDGFFYGTAQGGGEIGWGTLFRATAGAVSAVHSFANTDGAVPASPLLLGSDGSLYGTTTGGGDTANDMFIGAGTLFQLKPDGTFMTLVSFDYLNGEFPYQQGVIEAGGYLFGTTQFGGVFGWGTVYRWSTTTGIEVLRNMDGEADAMPNSTLNAATNGTLYGTGLGPDGGIIFRLVKDEVEAEASLEVAPATATYGGSTTLSATLSRSGAPVEGAEIAFTLNGGTVGSATTGADGVATLANVPVAGVDAGSYPGAIGASFAADAGVPPVTVLGDLTIVRAAATIAVADATYVYDGLPHPAVGSVTGIGGEALGPLTFTYNGGAAAPVEPGSYLVGAAYAGSVSYEPAGATALVTILVAPPGVDGLIAAYGFDEGAGGIAGDASGKGHGGTIKQALWTAGGRFGGALDFDGVNDWVTIDDAADLDIRNAITLEAWVNPRALFGWNTIVLKEGNGLAYSLYANDQYPRPAGYVNVGNDDVSVTGSSALALNTWSHVAMTYDRTMLRLYINGAEVSRRPLTGPILATGGALRIGGNSVWGEYFRGLIDEVRIYGRALSPSEIVRDMNMPIVHEGLPPTVSIVSPVDGAVLSGIPVITVSASDNLALSSVQLQVNGVDSGPPLAQGPFSFNLDAANGTYVVRALARDVAGNVALSGPITVRIASAPVADYGFNEGSGSVVTDASGHNNSGSITGGVTRLVDPTRGQVLSFNGSNGLVSIADSASLDLTTGMTLEAWVRPTSVDGWRTVLLKEGDGLSYALYANDADASRPAGYVQIDDRDRSVRGRRRLTAGVWTHLAMTYDGTTMRMFVNGEETDSRRQPGAVEVSAGKLRIGGNHVWGEWFRGQIDDVRIYDVPVAGAQIKADMNR